MTSKVERLQAALAGEVIDRPPVALWRHFPVDDQDPRAFSDAVVAFQRDFDFDLVKVTPASSFCVRDWGVEDVWQGSTEGTRHTRKFGVAEPDDWPRLDPLDVRAGAMGEHLQALRAILALRPQGAPVLATVFSPLAQARKLAGPATLEAHLHAAPARVLDGLETITRTTVAFVQAVCELGVDGVFYAIQHASLDAFDLPGYRRFGLTFDRRILEAADGLWLNLVHLHGENLLFELTAELPPAVVNWHDRETEPSLGEGRRASGRTVCGGLSREATLLLGEPGAVRAEAEAARRATDGGRALILGTGCVIPTHTPRANLRAARTAFDSEPGPIRIHPE